MKVNRAPLFVPALLFICALLVSCAGQASAPTDIATSFHEALREGDVDKVAQLLIPELQQRAASITERGMTSYPSVGTISSTLVSEAGDAARVSVVFELTPSQAVAVGPHLSGDYRYYGPLYQDLLTPDAYKRLFEETYYRRVGRTPSLHRILTHSIREDEPLYPYVQGGVDEDLLERFRTNPPTLDMEAVQALEEVAQGINRDRSDIELLREEVRPHLAALSEYVLYSLLLDRGRGHLNLDSKRNAYTFPLEVNLQRIDGKWRVAGD